jgi:hypothetical protein
MPKLTLTFKGRLIDVFHLSEAQTLIGRDGDCQIAIDSLAIAPRHAKVSLLQTGGCQIEALEEDFAVIVNHNHTEATQLQHGDVIQIGKHTLTYADDVIELAAELLQKSEANQPQEDAGAQGTSPSKGMLQIMSGTNFGRIIPLTRNMTRIGRVGGDCVMIAKRDSGYYISYLEGDKSPLLNNRPIGDGSWLLNDGDVIEIGKTQMQFHR